MHLLRNQGLKTWDGFCPVVEEEGMYEFHVQKPHKKSEWATNSLKLLSRIIRSKSLSHNCFDYNDYNNLYCDGCKKMR